MNPREKWLIGLLAASVLVNGLLGIGLGWAAGHRYQAVDRPWQDGLVVFDRWTGTYHAAQVRPRP